MYPDRETLQEVGRVTIAGSRVEIAMSQLRCELDPSENSLRARRLSAGQQRAELKKLASERLCDQLRSDVLGAIAEAEAVGQQRNDVIHQDWVLGEGGREAFWGTLNIDDVPRGVGFDELAERVADWHRSPVSSSDWQNLPARTITPVPAQTLKDLRQVEDRLSKLDDRLRLLSSTVMLARQTGQPPGWVGPQSTAASPGLRPPGDAPSSRKRAGARGHSIHLPLTEDVNKMSP